MIRVWGALLVSSVFASVVGCSSSQDCPANPERCVPVLRLDLRDPSGNRITSGVVTVTSGTDGSSVSAMPCAPSEACSYAVVDPNADLVVSVNGYEPASVPYSQASDECGDLLSQNVELTLVPTGGSDQPSLTRTLNATCG
jgi:hypothetical protein